MKITKQEQVLNEIIYSVVQEEKTPGDRIISSDYDLGRPQMTLIFKELQKYGIVVFDRRSKCYRFTDDCVMKAKEFYITKINDLIDQIKCIAECCGLTKEDIVKLIDKYQM